MGLRRRGRDQPVPAVLLDQRLRDRRAQGRPGCHRSDHRRRLLRHVPQRRRRSGAGAHHRAPGLPLCRCVCRRGHRDLPAGTGSFRSGPASRRVGASEPAAQLPGRGEVFVVQVARTEPYLRWGEGRAAVVALGVPGQGRVHLHLPCVRHRHRAADRSVDGMGARGRVLLRGAGDEGLGALRRAGRPG